MRTTFSAALLMGLACAQNPGYNPWNPSGDVYPAPVVPTPTPDVRPEECEMSITAIDGDIDAIETDCNTNAEILAEVKAKLDINKDEVAELVDQNRDNSVALAMLAATKDQTLRTEEDENGFEVEKGQIPDLKDRIDAINASIGESDDATTGADETIAQKLQRLMEKLKLYKDLINGIEEEEKTCAEIEATQMKNQLLSDTINGTPGDEGSLNNTNDSFNALIIPFSDCEMSVEVTIPGMIMDNELLNVANSDALDLIDCKAQVVSNDFFTQNDAPFEFDDDQMGEVGGPMMSSFMVKAGVHFEFWSYLNAEAQTNGVLNSIMLVNAGGDNLAVSERDAMLVQVPPPDRSFPILYKGVGDGSCMKIKYTAVTGSSMPNMVGNLDEGQHMWGVRTFTEDWTAPETTLCDP